MAFSSCKIFWASSDLIPAISTEIAEELKCEGYDVSVEELSGNNVEISICKGGFFRSITGMKTALKIDFVTMGDKFKVDCKVGIFGQQAVPTAISMLLFSPVVFTQVWGLIKQSKLDDHVLELVESAIGRHSSKAVEVEHDGKKSSFCSQCGAHVKGVYCSACGAKL
jgi:hypothetical protein